MFFNTLITPRLVSAGGNKNSIYPRPIIRPSQKEPGSGLFWATTTYPVTA